MRAGLCGLIERIGAFGSEPIKQSNWRARFFVVGAIVVVALGLVVILVFNESRPPTEEDLPADLLGRLEVTEFKGLIGRLEWGKTTAGKTSVKSLTVSGVGVWIRNDTDWTITSCTLLLTGKTADGKPILHEIHCNESIGPRKSIRTDLHIEERLPESFPLDECEIIRARGRSP